MGEFIVAAIPAEILLNVAYSHRLEAIKQPDGSYRLEGSQRELSTERLENDIAPYIRRVDAAFPNSVILAANAAPASKKSRTETAQSSNDDADDDEDTGTNPLFWTYTENDANGAGVLHIPTNSKMAAVIDGQHRLFSFAFVDEARRGMPLVCAIYFGMPKPYQAQLFATINSTQKKVDKSQTYELFGYNIENEPPARWSPDKLAVFLSRKLNTESDSPFCRHILIAAENDIVPSKSEAQQEGRWMVSTATIVDGILRLISKDANADSAAMAEGQAGHELERSTLQMGQNPPPLRGLYLEVEDNVIYTAVKNFFIAANECLWKSSEPGLILKTVGIQAQFDILRKLAPDFLKAEDVSIEWFSNWLLNAKGLNFSDAFLSQASGQGRTRIRNVIELRLGLKAMEELSGKPFEHDYRALAGT